MAKFSADDRVRCIAPDFDITGSVNVGDVLTVGVIANGYFRALGRDGVLWTSKFELVTPAEPVRPTRKIVQIAMADEYGLNALCDDGTLWAMTASFDEFAWTQLPPIPQPESAP